MDRCTGKHIFPVTVPVTFPVAFPAHVAGIFFSSNFSSNFPPPSLPCRRDDDYQRCGQAAVGRYRRGDTAAKAEDGVANGGAAASVAAVQPLATTPSAFTAAPPRR